MTVSFVYAPLLVLLALTPLAFGLFVWRRRAQHHAWRQVGDPVLLRLLAAEVSQTRRWWKTGLWLVALTAVIIALARPVWGFNTEVVETQGVSVMIVLDVSNSMNALDVSPSRLERAKLSIRALMDELVGNEVGLILFAGSTFVQFPLTTDMLSAETFLKAASSASISRQGTAVEDALRLAMASFEERRSVSRIIVLVTDGESHDDNPLAAADEAAQRGITIDTIGYGSAQGEPIPIWDANGNLLDYKTDAGGDIVLSKLNESVLQAVAEQTGGIYLPGGSDEISRLVEHINQAQAGVLDNRAQERGVERFGIFAAAALLALSLEMLMSEKRGKLRDDK